MVFLIVIKYGTMIFGDVIIYENMVKGFLEAFLGTWTNDNVN